MVSCCFSSAGVAPVSGLSFMAPEAWTANELLVVTLEVEIPCTCFP